MDRELTINRKKLLSLKEIVGQTRYTRDHVAKLAREGSIFGVQVGRQWFIDAASLAHFEQVSDLERQVRHRQLSGERRREHEVKQVLGNKHVALISSSRYSLQRGVAKTFALLVCGVVAGCSVYVLPAHIVLAFSSPKNHLAVVATWFAPKVENISKPSEAVQISKVIFEDLVETKQIASSTDGVMLLPASGRADTALEVEALFSDPVAVEFTDLGVGVLRTHKGSGQTPDELVRFVVVPLTMTESVGVSEATE